MALEYHEPREQLTPAAIDEHRAISSLIEELEAVAWYNQRATATSDASLQAVLEHNRDEEIEHAAMLLEWLRRNVPAFDENLKTYLFTKAPITELEEEETGGGSSEQRTSRTGGDLGIGSMLKEE